MERIYIYDGYFEQGEKGNPLIRKAAALFCEEAGIEFKEDAEIIRPENGKPYFKDLPVKFSLSHSGIMWMCVMSTVSCGLDVQITKPCKYQKLTERFFNPDDYRYVELWGESGFYDLWVRKEAFAKCTGKGIFSQTPAFTDENHNLAEKITVKGRTYYFKDIHIAEDIRCAVCSIEEIHDEMRLI